MVRKFDRSGNGTVSLKDFFAFLGAEDYVPNVIQRMTKIFSLATEKGLTFKDIFDELDEDKNGILDALDLKKGLHRLGTFGEVSTEDSEAIVKQFDHSGEKNISLAEFVSYFSLRVKQAAAVPSSSSSSSKNRGSLNAEDLLRSLLTQVLMSSVHPLVSVYAA